MANKFQLEVVTPSKQVVSEEVELASVPGGEGAFGVMANHAPLLSTLATGEMRYEVDGQITRLAISGGFCEVSNNVMTVLAESAEKTDDIDVQRALKAKERAEKRIQQAATAKEDIDLARAQAALARAMNRLKLAGRA
jgi:F-type H+-transporting ATPase subunit epsilon